jgi:hypothetical protein
MSYSYIPGTCNLGKEEIRRRQFVALIGLVFSIISLVGLISTDAQPLSRVSLFLPLMVFAIGYIQSRKKFCLAYGLMGTFNLGKLGDLAKVQSPEDRKADRKTAMTIFGQAVLLAGGLTVLVVLLPF